MVHSTTWYLTYLHHDRPNILFGERGQLTVPWLYSLADMLPCSDMLHAPLPLISLDCSKDVAHKHPRSRPADQAHAQVQGCVCDTQGGGFRVCTGSYDAFYGFSNFVLWAAAYERTRWQPER